MSSTRDRADSILNEALEVLLTSGGDDRMTVSVRTGLNRYGTSPRRRGAGPLGNCTASSPTSRALEGARAARDRLRIAARAGGQDGVDACAEEMLHEARGELLGLLDIDAGDVEVAFCPSGTDAEYLALTLARGGTKQAIVNIVAGPSEVGSGTSNAAAGKHFNPMVPSGETRVPGQPIDDELGRAVEIRSIIVRDDEGLMRETADLDAEAKSMVDAALSEGKRVMLHVVAHSKTGVHAPSLDCVAALRERHGSKVSVMIDAAQGRLSRRGLREALALGYMVMFTGSKFYGGPPFSGSLFVPLELWPASTDLDGLSPGLSDFISAAELPRSWKDARASVPVAANLGLVLRWAAALAEIRAYYEIAPEMRHTILRCWEEEVPKTLGASRFVRLFPVVPHQDADSKRLLESKTTVFPFFVRQDDASQPLNKSALQHIFRWLNRDMSGLLPELDLSQKSVLARMLHIGQPVLLSGTAEKDRSVLRIALGGAVITRVAEDERLGPTFEARLNWLRALVQIFRAKLELIVEHYDRLLERDPSLDDA